MSVAHDHGGFGPYTVEDLHAREDEGRGLELEDGWLVELSPSPLHNIAYRNLEEIVRAAAKEADASVFVASSSDWEVRSPAGVRKPDMFMVPRHVADSWAADGPTVISGCDLLLVAEVVSPGSGSERTDRVRKLKEYAAMSIPQYWLVEYTPEPRVQVFVLDDLETDPVGNKHPAYRLDQTVRAGEVVETDLQVDKSFESDKSFTVRFDPQVLTDY